MQRFWEYIFGLENGFLSRDGEFFVQFNPKWPWQDAVGAGTWNFLLVALAVFVVVMVYRREGRSRPARIVLGGIRLTLLLLVIALLNRPVLTLSQSRTEPSVLAILLDDSISMRVRDVASANAAGSPDAQSTSRLDAAIGLLTNQDRELLKRLSRTHQVRLYSFDRDAKPILSVNTPTDAAATTPVELLEKIEPDGQHTQVVQSVRSVLDDLQGQRLAGIVVLTDGRETPAQPVTEALAAVKEYGVKVFPVVVGSDRAPSNVAIQSINVQDSVFKGDIVNVRAMIRGSGYDANHPVKLVLKDKRTGQVLTHPDGRPAETSVNLPDDKPFEAEVQFQPGEIGTLDLLVEAVPQAGELDEEDNVRATQVSVLDAKIAVLYVDGYPRWEYRYIKNEMIRDQTVEISCLLTSADPSFAQEGDKPVRRFPESIEEIMEYDAVVFGDVDPRQFTDGQLQLIHEFVSKKGGGFGMIAGPRWAPSAYRNTAIESILPVVISRSEPDAADQSLTQGFRPVLTKEGESSSIFRFFTDRERNQKFLTEGMQPIFWYSRGVTVKPGVGEVYAEHPTDIGPDGRKSPILTLGRFGAGRTLFSAIDDSWRWRFYTGESIFDTYWVQQFRYLARSKKLGQRRMTLTSMRPVYELGEQVRINLRILDPQLLQQLPDQLRVEVRDANGQTVRQEMLQRQEGQIDLYVASFPAERIGKFMVNLPQIAGGVDEVQLPVEVSIPRLELAQPQVDRTLLTRLASETLGQTIELNDAPDALVRLIPSAAKIIPLETNQPLWDAPLAMILFVLLITTEWIVRKMYGML